MARITNVAQRTACSATAAQRSSPPVPGALARQMLLQRFDLGLQQPIKAGASQSVPKLAAASTCAVTGNWKAPTAHQCLGQLLPRGIGLLVFLLVNLAMSLRPSCARLWICVCLSNVAKLRRAPARCLHRPSHAAVGSEEYGGPKA